MAFKFISKVGYTFAEHVGRSAVYTEWAKFEHAREHDTAEGEKRYVCATDDQKVAERLRAVDGVTELPADEPAEPEPAPPAVEDPAA